MELPHALNNSIPKNLEPIGRAEVITILGRIGEGNDGETYKAELIDAEDRIFTGYVKLTVDPRKIIAELATAQVGRALGLRVPRPFLILLDTDDLRPEFKSSYAGCGMMICFASQQAGKRSYSLERALRKPRPHIATAIDKQFDLAGTIALDELVANDDRHLGNIIYAPGKQEFWLIDHGRALTGTYWALWGLGDPTIRVGNTLADENAQEWDEAQRWKILNRAHELVKKCATLCLDDIDRNGYFARIDPDTDKQEIITFLQQRIHHTVPLLCNRLQLGHLSLTRPNPS
ncbi:TPA: hypothetical protein N0H64_000660 [Pseudomonas aeruginosa]|nr:hypothetical protein [Pseudomonas aeruginosa]HCK4901678.1 hypothetical protein [Pseudomonas aeruginosa]HCL3809934.1 hypothetical protein [Pseudomonas aeruginosa]